MTAIKPHSLLSLCLANVLVQVVEMLGGKKALFMEVSPFPDALAKIIVLFSPGQVISVAVTLWYMIVIVVPTFEGRTHMAIGIHAKCPYVGLNHKV